VKICEKHALFLETEEINSVKMCSSIKTETSMHYITLLRITIYGKFMFHLVLHIRVEANSTRKFWC